MTGAPKALKLAPALATTAQIACGLLAQYPGMEPLGLDEAQAGALGEVWANYIESVPAAQKKLLTEALSSKLPLLMAVGTTLIIFAPKVQAISANRAAAAPQSPRLWAVPGAQPPRPPQGPPPGGAGAAGATVGPGGPSAHAAREAYEFSEDFGMPGL